MARKTRVVGSGNVFADLGHPRPAEALAKAELARKIGAIIERRGLTQAAAAEVIEVDQPKVSALIFGRLAGFSRVYGVDPQAERRYRAMACDRRTSTGVP